MAPLPVIHTRNTTVIMLREFSGELQGSSKVGKQRYSSFSDMLDEFSKENNNNNNNNNNNIVIH